MPDSGIKFMIGKPNANHVDRAFSYEEVSFLTFASKMEEHGIAPGDWFNLKIWRGTIGIFQVVYTPDFAARLILN